MIIMAFADVVLVCRHWHIYCWYLRLMRRRYLRFVWSTGIR